MVKPSGTEAKPNSKWNLISIKNLNAKIHVSIDILLALMEPKIQDRLKLMWSVELVLLTWFDI